jgi:radical SAM-linked protein
MKAQRLRVTFQRGEQVKYITHLDLMRYWERVLRRAGVPLAYSEGHNPTPQISLAAPLPVGVTSSCELMDVYLWRRMDLRDFLRRVSRQVVPGTEIVAVREIGLREPSLQSQVRWAQYRVEVDKEGRTRSEVEKAIERIMSSSSLPWQHLRDGQVRRYDLRRLIFDLWLEEEAQGTFVLGMRLRTDQQAAGRAEQVTAALGFRTPPLRIHRVAIFVEETPKVARAYRRLGEM